MKFSFHIFLLLLPASLRALTIEELQLTALAENPRLRAMAADVMKRIAAPMIGGLFTSFLLELLVYPAIYYLWKRRELGHDSFL